MPRDLFVYTRRESVISMDDLLSRMRARSLPLEWEEQLLTGEEDPGDWLAADLRSKDDGAAVSISFEKVDDAVIEETLVAHADVLRERDREALAGARARYRLVPGDADESGPLLVNLADVLAKASGGLVCDLSEGRFYSASEYASSHADELGE